MIASPSNPKNAPEPTVGSDPRIVLTLDAGGTNFAFSALRGGEPVGEACVLPSCGDDLEQSLQNLVQGFERLIDSLGDAPSAISFAFPGPADYPNGVVFNVGNLPAYGGGVAVAPFLEDRFGLPTYLNNDGDLFALGEAVAGVLPLVNERLIVSGSSRRCRNLFAVTLGTGLGGGAVINGELLRGDNSAAAEIWRLPSGLDGSLLAEEDASIRAIKRVYAQEASVDPAAAPTPAQIGEIAHGRAPGEADAAKRAFERFGRAVGATIATATCFFDGVVVLGGGLTGAADLFMPALLEAIGEPLNQHDGSGLPRLGHQVFDLRSEAGLAGFAHPGSRRVTVPGSTRTIACAPEPRLGVAISCVGANRATAIGAHAFAIQQLDKH
ncbi:N-acetylglucosamine repressor [Planctomycetes bacterium MalM25]|nr:N-acetylglucosamine repressor [Planctomycetes bacterium MalM25]